MYTRPIKNRLSKAQLESLDKELQSFRTQKKIGGDELTIFDTDSWLKFKKALNERGEIVVSMSEGEVVQPILYEQLMEDLEQLSRSKYKKHD